MLREVPSTTHRGFVAAGYYFNVNTWMAQHSNGTMKPSLPCSCPREAMSSSLSSRGIPSGCLFGQLALSTRLCVNALISDLPH